jgi:hypothetical protein
MSNFSTTLRQTFLQLAREFGEIYDGNNLDSTMKDNFDSLFIPELMSVEKKSIFSGVLVAYFERLLTDWSISDSSNPQRRNTHIANIKTELNTIVGENKHIPHIEVTQALFHAAIESPRHNVFEKRTVQVIDQLQGQLDNVHIGSDNITESKCIGTHIVRTKNKRRILQCQCYAGEDTHLYDADDKTGLQIMNLEFLEMLKVMYDTVDINQDFKTQLWQIYMELHLAEVQRTQKNTVYICKRHNDRKHLRFPIILGMVAKLLEANSLVSTKLSVDRDALPSANDLDWVNNTLDTNLIDELERIKQEELANWYALNEVLNTKTNTAFLTYLQRYREELRTRMN